MENPRGAALNYRTLPSGAKQSFLPPKSPFTNVPPSYQDYGAGPFAGPKGSAKQREGQKAHQRTSSESFLPEEQPSWLDDLLNEPETPVQRGGHRRSSSDSFAYLEASNNISNIHNAFQEDYNYGNLPAVPSWKSLDFERFREVQQAPLSAEACPFERTANRGWEQSLNSGSYPTVRPPSRDKNTTQSMISSYTAGESDGLSSTSAGKHEQEESSAHDLKGFSERRDGSYSKPSSEGDPKRAKQQFAQRSRVRKLQYIAELERNVQALQAEGAEAAAELEFLDRQNLILSMENKALKQRVDSLAQEQLIKCLEQEMLEREITRLRAVFYQQSRPQPPPQQQQKQQQQHSTNHHRRSNSRDLDSQFAALSLRQKETSSSKDSENGSLHT